MNNAKITTLKALLKGIGVEVLSFNSNKIKIRDFYGDRELKLPLENEVLNGKYKLNLSVYDDNSILANLVSTKDTNKLKEVSYKNDEDDVMIFDLMDDTAVYQICIGKNNKEHMDYIAINKTELVENQKNELKISYTNQNNDKQVIVTKDGNSVKINDTKVKMVEFPDKHTIFETSDELTFVTKALLAQNSNDLMQIFKKLEVIGPELTNIIIANYSAVYEFQILLRNAKNDDAVLEYISMLESKAVKKNILGIKD